MAIVYRHRRLVDNEVFYIGMSNSDGRISNSTHRRNPLRNNIVSKHGFYSEIIAKDLSQEEAFELEIFLIELYGRRDLGTGTLCNMTSGGEGSLGVKRNHSKETRLKMSISSKGIGKSENHIKNMKIPKKDKKIINIITKEEFERVEYAAKSIGMAPYNLSRRLTGTTKNNTNFRYK